MANKDTEDFLALAGAIMHPKPRLTVTEALARAIMIAGEARREWDEAPSGMRAGKLLIALSGEAPGYRADIDEIHEALSAAITADLQSP